MTTAHRDSEPASPLAALPFIGGFVTVAVCAAIFAVVPAPRTVIAQPAAGDSELTTKGVDPKIAGKVYASIADCLGCHAGRDLPSALPYRPFRSETFILFDEAATWKQKDIHSAALDKLDPTNPDNGPAVRMQAALKDKYGNILEVPQCLTCHSADKTPYKLLADKKYDDFATRDGAVNCTVCHGLYSTWQNEHKVLPDQKGKPIEWREKSPDDKLKRGMVDLRNPVVKAKLCVSCHVGSPELGRVVTHEMYAAGHPPLPPFELVSYMEGEPKHWGYPTDDRLKYFASVPTDKTWPLFHFHPAKDESYLGRHYAVGAVAALRAEAELLLADVEAKNSDGIDFARFDCYSCHHDLKSPSDRQTRGYAGPPGRPPLRAAIGVPAGVVARHAAGIDAGGLKAAAGGFDKAWGGLQAAALARPFGDPAKVRDSAKGVIAWADGFLKVQGECPTPLYSEAQAKQLREMIAAAATGNAGDPETAMCLAWGYLTLSNETKKSFPKEKLAALEGVMPLNVRVEPFSKMGVPASAQFRPRMGAINKFEAGKFTDAFGGLNK